MTRNLVSSLLLAGFVILSGCAAEPPQVVEVAAEDTITPVPEPIVVEEVRVPPDWTQAPSPSAAEVCKVPESSRGEHEPPRRQSVQEEE